MNIVSRRIWGRKMRGGSRNGDNWLNLSYVSYNHSPQVEMCTSKFFCQYIITTTSVPAEAFLCQHNNIYTGSFVDIATLVRDVGFFTLLTAIATGV